MRSIKELDQDDYFALSLSAFTCGVGVGIGWMIFLSSILDDKNLWPYGLAIIAVVAVNAWFWLRRYKQVRRVT